MASPKILHLSSEKSWGGGEQQIANLIKYLNTQGVNSVVCTRINSPFSHWCHQNKIQFYEMGFINGVDLRTALQIKNIVEKEGVDLLNSHSGKSHSIAYLAAIFGMKTPIVVHRRVFVPISKSGFSLRKYRSDTVKRIICVSDAIASMVKSSVDPEKVKIVHDGIDPARFSNAPANGFLHKEFNIDPSKKLIANISAISAHKDYGTFLRVAKIISQRRNDCHFLIVGDGKLEEKMKALSVELELTDSVTFTGFRNDVPMLFRELTLFLITSDTEGLGSTVIDSLYNGVPVVATRSGGIPELIRDGKDGYLCPPYDAECLAEKIELLLNSEEIRQAMKRSGQERSKEFTNVKMGEGVLNIYREVLNQK